MNRLQAFDTTLRRRREPLLAVTLLVAVIALLWAGVARPIISSVTDGETARERGLKRLARERGLLAAATPLKSLEGQLRRNPLWQRFYRADEPNRAAAQLESDVRGQLTSAHAQQIAFTALPATTQDGITTLGTHLTMILPIDELTSFLRQLAGHPKLVTIDHLVVQAPDYQEPDSNPALAVQMDLHGFLLPAGAGPPP